jgi:hypothetical protein
VHKDRLLDTQATQILSSAFSITCATVRMQFSMQSFLIVPKFHKMQHH